MGNKQMLTAPVSDYSKVVLAVLGSDPDAHRDVIATLSDPYRYMHVFDFRR